MSGGSDRFGPSPVLTPSACLPQGPPGRTDPDLDAGGPRSWPGGPKSSRRHPPTFKPAILDLPISIRTTFRAPGEARPYEDEVDENDYLLYRYRGTDRDQSDRFEPSDSDLGQQG